MEEEPSSQAWYMIQKQRDIEATVISETALGAEKGVFVGSMALLARMLDAAFAEGLVHDLPTKVKIGVANHAFNLMWSAWINALAGRYDAAADHWRSIDESPDFLAALHLKPALAQDFLEGQVRLKMARKTIKDELNRLNEGAGEQWLGQQKWRHIYNRFAHIDSPGVTGLLPISTEGVEPSVLVRPGGGVIHRWNLRAAALGLAESALNLLFWVAFAFQHVDEANQIWEGEAREFNLDNRSILAECAKEIGVEAA